MFGAELVCVQQPLHFLLSEHSIVIIRQWFCTEVRTEFVMEFLMILGDDGRQGFFSNPNMTFSTTFVNASYRTLCEEYHSAYKIVRFGQQFYAKYL